MGANYPQIHPDWMMMGMDEMMEMVELELGIPLINPQKILEKNPWEILLGNRQKTHQDNSHQNCH